jgi:hypothetical protein
MKTSPGAFWMALVRGPKAWRKDGQRQRSPNLIWNIQHHFPFFELLAN